MNSIYDDARVRMLTASFNWLSFNMLVIAWDIQDFVPTDSTVSDITTRARAAVLGQSMAVTYKSVSPNGTAQSNAVVIPDVPIGPSVRWLTVAERGSGSLILSVDDAVELPFVPNGLDLVILPDWLQNRGWFRP